MQVLVYEDNLIWSSRLLQSLRALGHEPLLIGKPSPLQAPIAIVNLGSPQFQPDALVPALIALGTHVIGHAGHKEKDLLALGKSCGCETVATNSELTFKLRELIDGIAV